MTQRTATAGCGCDGSCGCGRDVIAHADSFTRPRFFAGQLLTEEDLGLLGTYVARKNRLHNRYLVGAGVVCGLEVSCHECDGRVVNLQPGYALDCCGNDIVVPCPEEIDVVAMIRDLRIRERGEHGCGDPCAEGEDGKRDGATRHYCLYVRYAEELLEPVAPYATDQSCDGVCEPTRVREGFTVDLRCGPHEHAAGDTVVGRIRACLGDVGELTDRIGQVLADQRVSQALLQARDMEAAGARFAFRPDEGSQLKDAQQAVADLDVSATAMTADRSHEILEKLRVLRQYVALARAATDEQLAEADLTASDVRAAEDTLHRAIADAPRDAILSHLAAHDRSAARAVLDPSTAAVADGRGPLTEQLMRAGVPFDAAAQNDYTAGLEALREWLLVRLERSPVVTACTLRDEVAAVRITSTDNRQQWITGNTRAFQTLARAFATYLLDCVCAALEPPCPSCDDEGVLLACIDVVDCEVVDICNRVRTNVLTGPALRYWLAPLEAFHGLLERLCCEFELRLEAPRVEEVRDDTGTFVAVEQFQHFVAPSTSLAHTIRTEVGGRAGAGLEQALESVRRMVDAGTSPLDAVGLGGVVAPRVVPEPIRARLRDVTASAVATQVESVLADRPTDPATVAAVRRDVVEALSGGEIVLGGGALSDNAIRDVVPRVVEAMVDAQTGAGTAEDVEALKRQLAGFRGGTTRLREDLTARLADVTDQLEQARADNAEARERLAALEAQLVDG